MKSTKNILIAGLILMVLLNVCTLGYIFLKPCRPEHHKHMGEMHGPRNFLKKKLNLTDAQEKALDTLRKAHKEKMSVLRDRKNELRKKQLELLKTDPYDVNQGDALATEIGNCHKEMDKQMSAYFLSIKNLCTKEQQEKFNSFLDHISERQEGRWRRFEPDNKGREKDHSEF